MHDWVRELDGVDSYTPLGGGNLRPSGPSSESTGSVRIYIRSREHYTSSIYRCGTGASRSTYIISKHHSHTLHYNHGRRTSSLQPPSQMSFFLNSGEKREEKERARREDTGNRDASRVRVPSVYFCLHSFDALIF